MSTYYSQFGEDRWILDHVRVPRFGTFAEVGAFDGLNGSNTRLFEEAGWRGFLVEPDPEIGLQCSNNRECLTFVCAVGSGPDEQTFFVNKADRGTSGLKVPGEPIKVPVHRLDYLMTEFGFPDLDLLSVDTEGTEVDALMTLGSFRPRIVIAEFWSQPSPPAPEPLLAWAREHGYKEIHRTTANLIFERQ